MDRIIFFVSRPGFTVNVLVEAKDREAAKRYALHILGGDPDLYVVEPITRPGTHTAFLIGVQA